MLIWRAHVEAYITFGNSILKNSDDIDILGIKYDKRLMFDKHISAVAKSTAGKISALRRIKWLVSADSMEVLYKAQVRSSMEFAQLSWGGAAATHLQLLDKVQRRAERLIYGEVE